MLIGCPECNMRISSAAARCPHCDFPEPGTKSPEVIKAIEIKKKNQKPVECTNCGFKNKPDFPRSQWMFHVGEGVLYIETYEECKKCGDTHIYTIHIE